MEKVECRSGGRCVVFRLKKNCLGVPGSANTDEAVELFSSALDHRRPLNSWDARFP